MDNTAPNQPTVVQTTTTTTHPHTILAMVLLVAVVALGLLCGYLLFKDNKIPQLSSISNSSNSGQASIAGVLNINGTIPEGATFDLTATNGGNPISFETGMTANDNDSWTYEDATAGETYTIQGFMMVNGQQVATSSPVMVSAPATGVVLTMNITSESNDNATITGSIVVNGYVPANSTITVLGRALGASKFSTVASKLPGQARQTMTYSTATEGTTYEVQGVLLASDGTQIGTSGILAVTAPAANEVLTINSSATAPANPTTPTTSPSPSAKGAKISGTVTLNGVAPANSRIVILEKVYNTGTYSVAVDNITPVSGVSWTWTGPAQSTWYDMVAVLKQHNSDGTDTDLSTSSMVSVAAPATNVNMTLNSTFNLSAPTGQISVNCGSPNSSNVWPANVTFGAQSGAQSYWYEIGTTNGGNQLTNGTVNANGNNQVSINVSMQNGVTYYARYAYANQANLSAGNSQFSPFSATQTMQCGS